MTLLDALQKINKDQIAAMQLTDMAVGTVTKADPLEITMDVHQAALTQDVLVLTDTVRPSGGYWAEKDGELCAVWGTDSSSSASLAAGDKVLMLSVRHGQKYIVLSRL